MQRLRIATYNMHGARNLTALADVVQPLGVDVLLVQEALRWANPLTWCTDLADRFGYTRAAGGLPGCGNTILVGPRVEVRDRWTLRYPYTFGRSPRAAVIVDCTVAGHPFVAVGTHLDTDPAARLRQANELSIALALNSVPVFVGGDVNDTSDGPAWRRLASRRVDPAVAMGLDHEPTYPTGAPHRRIDVVFCDPTAVVRGYRVVDGDTARAASDHFPVVVDVELAG